MIKDTYQYLYFVNYLYSPPVIRLIIDNTQCMLRAYRTALLVRILREQNEIIQRYHEPLIYVAVTR